MSSEERDALLEEELLLVRNSGEIPEVALYGSLHFLCEAPDGPRLQLTAEESARLEEAALARYREIILRDLDLANRDLSLFRGIRRVDHNWRRFVQFCHKTGHSAEAFRPTAAEALLRYLRGELVEVGAGERTPSVNCSAETLLALAQAMGIADLPDGWAGLCAQDG
ncbi:MAG: hypothetical protein FWC49_02435 [Proteobacteria bacterium]|nr:hypothetical protein [Pseudomonadota bacterium]